jgi:hypothetical protein
VAIGGESVTQGKTSAKRILFEGALETLHVLPRSNPAADRIVPACDGLILPPYPGEMGIEIRYFLGRVEPWLQAGWRILSRRPELYPAGTAIRDDALTEAESELFARFGAVRLATGPTLLHPAAGRLNRARRRIAEAKARRLQTEWRRLLRPYLQLSESRPWTRWDTDLTTVSTPFVQHEIWAHADVRPPGYLPPAFTTHDAEWSYDEHVGVQIRSIVWNANGRNSDVPAVLAEARAAARHLSLPLLVYGAPDGCCILPERTTTTASLNGGHGLAKELGYLRSCRVMLAPNSGWADLMCWLRVPVLVEPTEPRVIFEMMAPFQPRMLLRRPMAPVEEQIDQLMDGRSALPELGAGVVDRESLDQWMSGS